MTLTTKSGRALAGGQTDNERADDPELTAAAEVLSAAERAFEDAAASDDADALEAARGELDSARAEVERVRAARRARMRRDQEEAAAEAEGDEAAQRRAFYEWTAEWVRRVGPVLAAQEQLKEATEHLAELGRRPKWPGAEQMALAEPWQSLDEGAQAAARSVPAAPGRRGHHGDVIVHDPTIDRVTRGEGASPGRPRIVERLPGDRDERLARLADAIEALSDDAEG